MALSDSVFLFEMIVEDFKNYTGREVCFIKSEFLDLFSLTLSNPSYGKVQKNFHKSGMKRITKIRKGTLSSKLPNSNNTPLRQSIILVENINKLLSCMNKYSMELSLWSKNNVLKKIGSSRIPWCQKILNYLRSVSYNTEQAPVAVRGKHIIFNKITSQCIAIVTINIKLAYLKGQKSAQFQSYLNLMEYSSYTQMKSNESESVISAIPKFQKHHTISQNIPDNIGIIKTFYSRGKNKLKFFKKRENKHESSDIKSDNTPQDHHLNKTKNILNNTNTTKKCKINLVKSEQDITKNKQLSLRRAKSFSMFTRTEYKNTKNMLNYIFGDRTGPFGNKTYCVGYCTVEQTKSRSASPHSDTEEYSQLSTTEKSKHESYKSSCKQLSQTTSSCSADAINITKCNEIGCDYKPERDTPSKDDRILLDFTEITKTCCSKKVENIVGGVTTKMQVGPHPCLCSCECTFGFIKKTTYCGVCGGYEKIGQDLPSQNEEKKFPCPIFHKFNTFNTKSKSKLYNSGSDIHKKKMGDSNVKNKAGVSATEKRSEKKREGLATNKSESKIRNKKKQEDKFKFNYDYKAPQRGYTPVVPIEIPKNMGWLWTADNVPGLKFRPYWKPGGTNKKVVKLLRIAKNPEEASSKKRKRPPPFKKPLKRPLLVVHKKSGEFKVSMEPMKQYAKPRTLNQHPYDDKPVLTYTIGRTDEENKERQKKKERAQRRLERDQRAFIQSAFKNVCEEICLKTYQQALGILPNAEDPICSCYPAEPDPKRTNMDMSCSCSLKSSSICSDTDDDEWILELTPPVAMFDPQFKLKKSEKVDNSSQYTYLDYRVDLVDHNGNPVPRFFKGPDGREQCSDLGGFWGPDKKWLKINIDGFISPDGRWAPMLFIGPNGEQIEAENGKFQDSNGNWLFVGEDGYVDSNGRWRAYSNSKRRQQKKTIKAIGKESGNKIDNKNVIHKLSETNWSCFGDASPRELSKLGIVGHGFDRKLLQSTLKTLKSRGEQVNIPVPSTVPRRPGKIGKKGKKVPDLRNYFLDREKCHHSTPSEKGILAVDDHGNKTYFKLKNYKNKRPKDRIRFLKDHGISLSSFHVPCFNSFINSEVMKQQQRERLTHFAQSNNVATQA